MKKRTNHITPYDNGDVFISKKAFDSMEQPVRLDIWVDPHDKTISLTPKSDGKYKVGTRIRRITPGLGVVTMTSEGRYVFFKKLFQTWIFKHEDSGTDKRKNR